MRGRTLKGFTILHHRFHSVGRQSTRKLLSLRFLAGNYWNRQIVLLKASIHLQHLECLFLSFFIGFMGSVSLLPKELRSPEKKSGSLFPTHHVSPLVDQNRQISIAIDPLRIHVANHCFGSWTDDQWLFQFFTSPNGHHRTLWAESLNMLSFSVQELLRNQQREVGIYMSCFFEHSVQPRLHCFPDCKATRANDHASLDRSVISQLTCFDNIQIPLGVVVTSWGNILGHGIISLSL